jgi:hypothetical protein
MPALRLSPFALAVVLVSLASGNALAQTTIETEQVPPPAVRSAPPASESRVTWMFTERVRYAGLFNQFRPGHSGDDRALVFRTTLQAEFASRFVTLGGEIQDARAYFTDAQSNVSTALVNPIDLLQAYVRVGGRTTPSRVPDVQLGRFSMELGSGRLIAQEAYRDVTRTFTGAKALWSPHAHGIVTAFGVFPVATLPDDRDALLHNRIARDAELFNQRFWGALYERDRLRSRIRAEAYAYGLREHDDPGRRETRDRKLWTAGLRLYRAPSVGAWDLDVESAWQGGRAHATSAPSDARDLAVSARLLHAHAGRTLNGPWSPRVGVEYDYGTGDRNPVDDQWNRFDGLFGNRRVELGPTSIYGALGRENIDTIGVRLSLVPTARVDAFAVYRRLWLAAAADGFASTGVRDAAGWSGREAGQQIDARVRAWIVPGLVRLDVGATHLIAGTFLRSAPNATRGGNSTFFYGDVTYTFGSTGQSIVRTARP